jgi:hypothetical protein
MGTFTVTQTPDAVDIYIYPNSDVAACVDLTPVGEALNHDCVDEDRLAPDDDTTYVYNNTVVNLFDIYGLPNQSLAGTINYVQVYARAKSHLTSQHADGIYKILVSPDGSCTDIYTSDDINVITSYTTYLYTWTDNPQTSVAWLWSDINAMGIGVKCNSPVTSASETTLTIRPNLDGDVVQLDLSCTPHYQCVDEAVQDGYITANYNSMGGTLYDLYELDDHTTETGTINKVIVYAYVRTIFACPNCWAKTVVKTHATEYRGSQETEDHTSWKLISTTYLTNPNTSAAWTWNEIDDLQAGIELYTDGVINSVTQAYVVVYYDAPVSPEIRTTQCYAKVNYVPGDIACTLQKPNKVSTNHSRNIKMLNFWSENRVVYDLNRSGKSMVLVGTEYDKAGPDDVCTRIQCIQQQAESGADVVISGLGSSIWDGTYKIRSFGWIHVSECPDVYDWILELEDTRYCGECGDYTYS